MSDVLRLTGANGASGVDGMGRLRLESRISVCSSETSDAIFVILSRHTMSGIRYKGVNVLGGNH